MDMSWMDKLKPGDPVIVRSHGMQDSVAVVLRMTKTQIVTKHMRSFERKWRRKDGKEVGGSRDPWNIVIIVEADQESLDKIKHARRVERIRAHFDQRRFKDIDTVMTSKVFDLVVAQEKKEGDK